MRFRLGIGLFLVLLAASAGYWRINPARSSGILDIDPPTPYFRYAPAGSSRGRVLAVHGLASNKNTVSLLCYGLADAGFEVYAIDLPGHGDSGTPFNALAARSVIDQTIEKLGPLTAVLGHSLGGALLLDVLHERRVDNVVLLSPAPVPLEALQAGRVLVVEGAFDPAAIRAFAPQMREVSTGEFESRELPWTGHSGALFKPEAIAAIARWLGSESPTRTGWRWALLGAIFASSISLGVLLLSAVPASTVGVSWQANPRIAILSYVLAACASAFVLGLVRVGGWLRLFPVDHLVGLLFLTGVLLLFRLPRLHTSARALLVAAAAAAYVLAVPGALAASAVVHLTLSAGRPWRFAAIVLLSLPLFLADETLLRQIRPWWKAAGLAILSRILLAAAAISGVLIVNRESSFLLLLILLILAFWIGLWFAGEAIHRRAGVIGSALFMAVVQAWVFAAVFVVR